MISAFIRTVTAFTRTDVQRSYGRTETDMAISTPRRTWLVRLVSDPDQEYPSDTDQEYTYFGRKRLLDCFANFSQKS